MKLKTTTRSGVCFLGCLMIFLVSFSFQSRAARQDSISINLQAKKITLSQVFETLQRQTGFIVFYNNNLLNDQEKVDVHFEHASVKQVMNYIVEGRGLRYSIKDRFILLQKKQDKGSSIHTPPAFEKAEIARDTTISGTVTDEEGQPLIGVSVGLKGSNQGAVTDQNGQYGLTVSDLQGALIFSYVGYDKKEVPINGRRNIDVEMEAGVASLDQLVVVGYGVQKKGNLTGAVDQIEAEDIALRPSGTINGTLQGLMPGLHIQMNNGDPSANPDLNIRGFTSINGGGPLVLIDGIEGNLEDVNPNDIKSISVLKDAASAAIYGARGAFGVILVTTKTGKAGEIQVNYTNNFAWTTPTTRTDFVSDPYVYGKTVDAAIFGYNGASYTRYDNNVDWAAIKMVADGEIPPFAELLPSGKYKFFFNTNWYDYLFREYQPSQFHNISVSGGTEKIKAYLSGRVYNRTGINNIQNTSVDRYNLNTHLTYKPVDWLELSANIKYMNEQHDEYGGYRNGYGGIWSTTTWYNLFPFFPNKINGEPVDIGRSGTGGQGGAAAMEGGNNWRKFEDEKLTNTLSAKLTPVKGLELNMNYSDRRTHASRTYRYSLFDYLTTYELTKQTVGVNRLNQYRWKQNYKALNIFGSYSIRIHQDHNFKLMLGYNQESFSQDHVVAQSNGLLVQGLPSLGLATEMYNIDQTFLDWAIQGYFGRFNYDYKGKYLLEVDARYDGSSRFPEDSRWGLFPSVSAGWQINKENFWDPIRDYVSSFKLRASYGKLGNQSVPVNTFLQLMGVGQSSWLVGDAQKLIYARSPNPLPSVVTWESTKTINLGVNFGILDNKLLASFDWYKRETDHMYLPGKPLPGVFGATEPKQNYGALENRGFELSLTYQNSFQVAGKPLRLRVSANVSNFKGFITKFNNPQGLMSTYWEGQRLGEIWGYHVAGQFQTDKEAAEYQAQFTDPGNSTGEVYNYILNVVKNSDWNKLRAGDPKYVDLDGDGRIDQGDNTLEDHGDLIPIGNTMPQFPFGFNASASYRGFDISIAGAGVSRQDWSPTGDIFWGSYARPYISFIRKDMLTEAWTADNHGKYPSIYRGYAALGNKRSMYEANDYYLINVGFLRVKNLTVGYTIPQSLTKKVFIEKARIYFSGDNIFTLRFGDLTRYVDPEQAGSAINYSDPEHAVGRADLRAYPMGKTYSFGIQITL